MYTYFSYMHVCLFTYTYTCTHTHTAIQTHTHTHTHTYIHTNTYTYLKHRAYGCKICTKTTARTPRIDREPKKKIEKLVSARRYIETTGYTLRINSAKKMTKTNSRIKKIVSTRRCTVLLHARLEYIERKINTKE